MLLSVMEEKNAVHLQQSEKWKPLLKEKESLPVPPTTATLRIDRGVYDNPLLIENEHESLLELLDVVYPPLACNECDSVYNDKNETNQHFQQRHGRRRFKCLHPHCTLAFVSRGALRLHLSQSHLVRSIPPKTPIISQPSSSIYSAYSAVYSDLDPRSSASPSPSPPSPPPLSVSIPHNHHSHSHNSNHIHNARYRHHQHQHQHHDHHSHHHHHNHHNSHQNQNHYPSSLATQQQPRSGSISPTAPSNPLPRLAPAGPVGVLVSHDAYKRRLSGRAPRGSKKIILSAETDALLNKVYPPLECPACHRLFKRKTNVITHLTDDHYGQEPYHCIFPQCSHPKLYATREGLVYHILRAHDTEPAPSATATTSTASTTSSSSSFQSIPSKNDIVTACSKPRRRPSSQPLSRLPS